MLRVALAQINTTVGDLDGNSQKIIAALKEAEKKGAQFIAFPELAITGYPPEDLLLKPLFIAENMKRLEEIAKETGDLIAIVGFADKVGTKVYNAAAVIQKGNILSVYHKILLPNYSVFDEKRYFEPSANSSVFVLDSMRFGVNICEDICHPVCPAVNQCLTGGADILFNISASPYFAGKRQEREVLLQRLAGQHGVFIVYANLIGGQDELLFDGSSMVLNNRGEIIASASPFVEEILYVDIEVPLGIEKKGARKDPSFEVPGLPMETIIIEGQIKKISGEKSLPLRKARFMESMEEIYLALSLGVREYVTKNGFREVVIGLSGGIDSALVAAIAVEALGSENVIGVTMPSVYSSEGSVSDSDQLAKNLSIRFLNIPIASVVDSFEALLSDPFKGTERGLAEENLQARIRGTLLMTLSNKFGWLVLTTGNKSETSVGYCTLYGDMAGGFAVIKDVYKTTVYELAKWVNSSRGKEIIPPAIIEKEPSAELRPEQKDTDSLPPYEVLDPILVRYVEKHKVLSEIVEEGFDRDLVKKVISLVDLNEYKRRQAPPGIKITPQAFGKDRRLPIVNKYCAWKG
jgi:NAD+ synthase (glutamine-hydrolysing)